MLPTPQFFYFDLGNVLLNFDHEIACRQMAELAGVSTDRVREIVFESDLEWRYERGDIDCREFYEAFCRQTESEPDFEELKHAASSIFELNEPVANIVENLNSAGRRLGIFSNTCPAHWQYVSDGRYDLINGNLINGDPVNGPFEIYALSYKLRAMKPEAKIYPAAAELAGYEPEKIFFVDDRQENVQAALEAGFDAVQFTGADSLTGHLQERGAAV